MPAPPNRFSLEPPLRASIDGSTAPDPDPAPGFQVTVTATASDTALEGGEACLSVNGGDPVCVELAASLSFPGVTLDGQGRIAAYDFEVQCRAVFENVRMVLEDAGSSWDKIVDVTVYLTDMKDFPVLNRLWTEAFAANRPTRTTVEVTALPTPIAIELKVVATAA